VKIDVSQISFKYLKKSPCCFQAYIEKEYELRIVVLFDKVFPCKIYSQNSELTKDDWRIHDDANVKWEIISIPEDIERKLIFIREKLGLTWCSIDLIYGKDHNYYFLEVNRPGHIIG
jgi:glutathione synthase/RimK-type ligase-like ATP-grasp enzyme